MSRQLLWLGLTVALWSCSSMPAPWSKQPAKAPEAPVAQPAADCVQQQKLDSPYYSLKAASAGPCIQFEITSHAQREIPVSPYDFALIPRGENRHVPFDPQIATVDVSPAIRPGETLRGRAIFHEFKSPSGHKLVFNPRLDFASGKSPVLARIGEQETAALEAPAAAAAAPKEKAR